MIRISTRFLDITAIRFECGSQRQRCLLRVREINLTNGNFKQLKVSTPPNGHDESNYIVQRSYGISGDGQRIPLTIVHHRDVTPHPESPVLLTGYGAYGMSLTPGFSASRRTLLTRGVIHVTAHVRGGMEKWISVVSCWSNGRQRSIL